MISNFKQPDLNAPRYREKVYSFLNKETFNEFKEKYPAYSNIDNEKLRSIIKIFNTRIWNAAIDNRDGIELPKSLGYLFIGTCKPPKSVNMDYALSKKYGKALQNENWETDGHLGKIFYTVKKEAFFSQHNHRNIEFLLGCKSGMKSPYVYT